MWKEEGTEGYAINSIFERSVSSHGKFSNCRLLVYTLSRQVFQLSSCSLHACLLQLKWKHYYNLLLLSKPLPTGNFENTVWLPELSVFPKQKRCRRSKWWNQFWRPSTCEKKTGTDQHHFYKIYYCCHTSISRTKTI